MNILLVDDSKAMRMIVRRTLRQAGYGQETLSEASNGDEALQLVQSIRPDLLLCDWNMPGMSGLELLLKLKSSGFDAKFGFVTSEPQLPIAPHSAPSATRNVMSTTSSYGRRPLGKPAISPASTPRSSCAAAKVGGAAVFSRNISDGTTCAG